MRCLALFTGGLDSQLAVRLAQEQRIDVAALHLTTPFSDSTNAAKAAAATLGIELVIADFGDEYARFLRQPRFGYVSGVAACTDCRIAMFAAAREKMAELQADLVISGEVVGQRPRTAIRDLEVVAHHAGLADLLVRPLTAQLLPPTLPEKQGWIDRSRLLGLQGKSRKPQLEMVRVYGIDPPPARPDCPLLAGPLAAKALDLVRSQQTFGHHDLTLLPIGRHYRLDAKTKVVVGRSRQENEFLSHYFMFCTDSCLLIKPADFAGPTALVSWEGGRTDESAHLAACATLIAGRNRFASQQPIAMLVRSRSGESRVAVTANSVTLPRIEETADFTDATDRKPQ